MFLIDGLAQDYSEKPSEEKHYPQVLLPPPPPPPLFSFCYSHSKDLLSLFHCISKNLKKKELQAFHHPPTVKHLSSVQNTVSKVNGSARVIHFKLSASVFTLMGFNQISTPSKPAKMFNSGFPRRFCQGCCKFLMSADMMFEEAAVFE